MVRSGREGYRVWRAEVPKRQNFVATIALSLAKSALGWLCTISNQATSHPDPTHPVRGRVDRDQGRAGGRAGCFLRSKWW